MEPGMLFVRIMPGRYRGNPFRPRLESRISPVGCEVVTETADSPYEAIIRVAEEKGCDLIMMASHGRRGVKAILIGSETQKVLTHSNIPVLVYR
jgi:nucleotide-binding universal stress UspA family protein